MIEEKGKIKKTALISVFTLMIIFSIVFTFAIINSSDIQLTSPANNSYTNDSTPDMVFNATSSVNSTVSCLLVINDSLYGSNTSVVNNTATIITANGSLAEGYHSWYVNCTDANGTNQSGKKFFFVDLTAPQILISAPENEYFSNQTSFNFDYNITDSINNTINCSFTIDDVGLAYFNATWNLLIHDTMGPYAQGKHNWSLSCVDQAGSRNTTSTRNFTVDTTSPTYSDNSTNSTSPGEYVLHRLYWQDTYGLAGYIFSFNNGTGTFTNDTWTSMTGTTNWSNVTKAINSTLLTNISWKVYTNDSAGNWNESTRYNYTALESVAPVLTLNLPAANANLSSATVTFNCSATDGTGLANISLYGNWTGSWILNETVNLSGTANSTAFSSTKVVVTNSTYKWACYSCDNLSNCGFSSNQTFTVDTVIPTIHLKAPADETSTSTTSRTFQFNVTDAFPIKNCSLYLDGDLNQTKTSSIDNDGSTVSFTSVGLAVGETEWYVRCYDYAGNLNASFENWTITITSSDSGGSSGGGSSGEEDNCPPNEKRCSGGNVEQCLSDEWKLITNCTYGCNSVNFTCKTLEELASSGDNLTYTRNRTLDYLEINETIDFVLGNSTHTIFIKEVTPTSVIIEISSDPITVTFAVNETKSFDLNGNGKEDFSVTLVKIVDDTATLLIKAIDEPEIGGTLQSKPFLNFDFKVFGKTLSKWKWYIIAGLGVLVLVLIIVMIVMKKKKSNGKYSYVKINNQSVKIKKREGGGIRIEQN